jgi:hypothetical protein
MARALTRGKGKGLVKEGGMEESCAFNSKQEQLLDRQEARFEDNSIDILNDNRHSRHTEKSRNQDSG